MSVAGVEYIIVGGLAATAQGSSRLTPDIHIVYRRTKEIRRRLRAAFRLRQSSEGLIDGTGAAACRSPGFRCRLPYECLNREWFGSRQETAIVIARGAIG